VAISKGLGQEKIRVIVRKSKNKRKIMESKIKTASKINWQTLTIKQKARIHYQVNVSRHITTQPVHQTNRWPVKTLIQKEPNGHVRQCRYKEIIICRAWSAKELTRCYNEDGSWSTEKETLNWNDKIEKLKLKITNING